jgi:O-antigen biosynthesis protein
MVQPIPIFLYHSVDRDFNNAYRRWAISPSTFDRHMTFLAEHGCKPTTVSQFVEVLRMQSAVDPNTVLITFDDGLRDFHTGAYPILQRYGFSATLYVVAGHVGATSHWLGVLGEGKRAMLNWSEMQEISSHGIEIGAHSISHPNLDLLDEGKAANEIKRSKICLEDHLNKPVKSFAYPYGYASSKTRRIVRDSGFTSACRVRHALSSTEENRFALSRIIVTNDTTDKDMKSFLGRSGLPVAPPTDELKTIAWRQIRRFHHFMGM